MFTGIVQSVGIIKQIEHKDNEIKLVIDAKKLYRKTKIGDSVCVNGICLTIYKKQKYLYFYAMPETIEKTTISNWKINDILNLELALKANDFLGGHWVTGHIDGTAKLINKEYIQSSLLLKFSAKPLILNNIIDKGSITIDGISLTIVEHNNEWFSVCIIEHTQEVTNITKLQVNDLVNIETDYFVKIIKSNMERIK